MNKFHQNKNSPKMSKIKKVESKAFLNKIIKTTPSQSSIIMTSPTEIPLGLFSKNNKEIQDINMKDLIFNITDDHKTLINKNRKLAQYVIQSSNKISSLNEIIQNLENSKLKEKEEFLEKLDKISANYKTFAESHQKLNKINLDFENLKNLYEKNNSFLFNYEDFIKFTLLDFISNFKKLQNFINLNTSNSNHFTDFFLVFRDEMKASMSNFKLKLSKNLSNFDDYFKEFDKLINKHENIRKIEKNEQIIRSSSSHNNNLRPLTPEMENKEKTSHSKNNTLEAYNLPFKNVNKTKKNRKISNQPNSNRFIEFMENKHDKQGEFEDIRSSINSNFDNKSFHGRNNSQISQNNTHNNYIVNKTNDKALVNSLSLSEGFDLLNLNKPKEIYKEEKKNNFEKTKIFYVAKFDFIPKRKIELQFKKGDLIEVILTSDDGWWQGVLNGKKGMFPHNYVDKTE